MQPYTFAGDCQMSQALQMFIEEKGMEILEKNLYRHFVLHVSSLFEFGIIDPGQVLDAISQMQEFILEQNHWSEKIENNPETPVAKLEKDRKAPRKEIIPVKESNSKTYIATGKSLSEALIFASTNPQNDDKLFIELQVQYMKIPSSNLGRTCCVQKLFLTFRTIFVHIILYPCSAKRRASDKDLPVTCALRL